MDIPSTGPTSLRSNCTDDTDDGLMVTARDESGLGNSSAVDPANVKQVKE